MSNNDFKDSLQVTEITEREMGVAYSKFVVEQQQAFIMFINYLNKYINELREKGKVTNFLEIRARIKTSNSTIKNDKNDKILDDIFGIELICASELEIQIVRGELEKMLSMIRKKELDKDNGYKALHCVYKMNDDLIDKLNKNKLQKIGKDYFPVIEAQYKTIEVFYESNYGTASHEKYKNMNMDEIQRLYNAGLLVMGTYIPYMWISDPNNDNMKELSTEEAIKKLYPSIKLREQHEEKSLD